MLKFLTDENVALLVLKTLRNNGFSVFNIKEEKFKYKTMKIWDYKLGKNWEPKSDEAWIWYLERKINYDDWQGLSAKMIKKYFKKLHLDPGKRLMLEDYFKYYGSK